MNIITNNVKNELIIKKSKFITYLFNVSSINEVSKYLEELKNSYKDSSHICYSYILNNTKKYDDDNEPSKTAGFPMLNILEKNSLTNILAVVIRYYGGIKLGANGLIRAYSNSVKDALEKTEIKEYIPMIDIILTTTHDNLKALNSLTKDLNIIEKDYTNDVCYTIRLEKEYLNSFIDKVNNCKFDYIIKED